MKTHVEQLTPHDRPGSYRRLYKREVNRARRRLEKRLGEDAPIKNAYRGYSQ